MADICTSSLTVSKYRRQFASSPFPRLPLTRRAQPLHHCEEITFAANTLWKCWIYISTSRPVQTEIHARFLPPTISSIPIHAEHATRRKLGIQRLARRRQDLPGSLSLLTKKAGTFFDRLVTQHLRNDVIEISKQVAVCETHRRGRPQHGRRSAIDQLQRTARHRIARTQNTLGKFCCTGHARSRYPLAALLESKSATLDFNHNARRLKPTKTIDTHLSRQCA